MVSRRASRRRLFWCAAAALAVTLAIWLLWQPRHTVTFTHIVDVPPRTLWEHVADFNNIAALSPLITEFDLGEESGSFDDWRYTVTYKEKMTTLPLVGHATSTYRVRPLGNRYQIQGTHVFCYLTVLCSSATNVMEFAESGRSSATYPSTQLTETITYDCPLGLAHVCERETKTGRLKFMRDLQLAIERS